MVALGLVVGAVTVVGSFLSDETATTSADSTVETSATTVPDSDSVATVGSVPTAASVDSIAESTTTIPDAGKVPTSADPARVLLLGDSEAGGLSPFLEPVLEDTGIVTMELDYKVSSGLVRTDFFDWPARLREHVPLVNPDIVIALFGGNDGQAFLSPTIGPVDSPEWRAEYAKRVAEVIDIVTEGGRTLIWVGVPNAEDDKLTKNLQVQNEVVKTELANHPEVLFVDAWKQFTGLEGGFAPYVVDPRDGEFKPVRSETDGFHLNRTGEEILASLVATAVTADLRERGASI